MIENKDGSKSFTKEDLDAMTPEAANNLLMLATKIEGKGVVRRADGTIRYDSGAEPGTYGEEHIT